MKKIFALLLALGLVMSLTACDEIPGQSEDESVVTDTDSEESSLVEPNEDGYAEGFLGDTMRTAFFDFTVNSAYLCDEFEDYTPSEGNVLLVAEVTFFNYTVYSQPMYDSDMQVQWSDTSDDAFALPITYPRTDLYPNTGVEAMGDMFPGEFYLGIQETRTGLLVYEVPSGERDFYLFYQEYYTDESVGDLFYVCFTPEDRTGADSESSD